MLASIANRKRPWGAVTLATQNDPTTFKRSSIQGLIHELWIPVPTPRRTSQCLTCLHHLMQTAEGEDDVMSCWMSFMVLACPELADGIISNIEKMGYHINWLTYPTDYTFEKLHLYLKYKQIQNDIAMNTVIAGQLMLIPFKNISDVNFVQYMTNRTFAMCAMVGLDRTQACLPMTTQAASIIRRKIGCNLGVRRLLLEGLQSASMQEDAGRAAIASYILKILEWTDMAAYNFIMGALVYSGSPVLLHPYTAAEVHAFISAVHKINECPYPQFFRLLSSPSTAAIVDRNSFPILFSVSVNVLKGVHHQAGQIQNVRHIEKPVLDELLNLHNSILNRVPRTIEARLLEIMPVHLDRAFVQAAEHKQYLGLDREDIDQIHRREKEGKSLHTGDYTGENA